jgi:hypothetical protein
MMTVPQASKTHPEARAYWPTPMCVCADPVLVVDVDGMLIPVAPSDRPGGLFLLYLAHCRSCGGLFDGGYRVAPSAGGAR